MLDIIQARLATLERLQPYTTPKSSVDTTLRTATEEGGKSGRVFETERGG